MVTNTDIAIIGAGPVGLFAVFEAGMLKMKTTVIDTLDYIGGQCTALYPEKPIYDIPAHPKIFASELIENLRIQAEPFKPQYMLGQQVTRYKKLQSGEFEITTDKNNIIRAKVIIIAAGCGAFGPNRPPLEGLESYEKKKSVQYMVQKSADLKGKDVVIAGGGDSAVDWAVILSDIAKSVSVVHRRAKFRCAPDNAEKLKKLETEGKIKLVIPYQLHKLHGQGGILDAVEVIDLDGSTKEIKANILLPFFGLSMELGPISDWKLQLKKNHIEVNQTTMKTNIDGVYAIGDIATYPGKLKLILNGFGEAAMACHDAYNIIHPETPLHFEYSTTKGVTS
ncbi:MAG: NAD(P)/FAD-dependent oxidoreductase [Rickettsiales bacterium]